jgi:hypothetical protein
VVVGLKLVKYKENSPLSTPSPTHTHTHRMTRVLTCKTYLKRLNVTKQMADHILPLPAAVGAHSPDEPADDTPPAGPGSSGWAAPHQQGSTSSGSSAVPGGAAAASSASGGYITLFKLPVVLVDESNLEWTVQYEGTLCGQQRHLRITAGWPAFVRAQRAAVGDVVLFERRGGARRVLHVRMLRAGGGDGAGGAASKERGGV